MKIVSLRNEPHLLEPFIAFFAAHWGNEPLYRDCMTAAGNLKVKTPLFSVAVQKSPVSLKLNESLLPRNFFVTVTEERPDKGKIRAALEGGTPVPGASLEQGTHLRIR